MKKLIRNRDNGVEIEVAATTFLASDNTFFYAQIKGDNYGERTWYKNQWELIEEHSNVNEVIRSLPIGTVFQVRTERHVKLNDDTILYLNPGIEGKNNAYEVPIPGWGSALEADMLEVMYKPEAQ